MERMTAPFGENSFSVDDTWPLWLATCEVGRDASYDSIVFLTQVRNKELAVSQFSGSECTAGDEENPSAHFLFLKIKTNYPQSARLSC
jgi:hypothetical protein